MQPDQGEQAGHLRFGRHEVVQQRGEELGVIGEVAGLRLAAATGQVALVEQQVYDGRSSATAKSPTRRTIAAVSRPVWSRTTRATSACDRWVMTR